MKYVAVIKRVKDLPKRGKDFYGVDENYPLQCVEYDSHEAALSAHPDSDILSEAEYLEHKIEMDKRFHETKKSRPFWKFWV